jgi:hypothetical protein
VSKKLVEDDVRVTKLQEKIKSYEVQIECLEQLITELQSIIRNHRNIKGEENESVDTTRKDDTKQSNPSDAEHSQNQSSNLSEKEETTPKERHKIEGILNQMFPKLSCNRKERKEPMRLKFDDRQENNLQRDVNGRIPNEGSLDDF